MNSWCILWLGSAVDELLLYCKNCANAIYNFCRKRSHYAVPSKRLLRACWPSDGLLSGPKKRHLKCTPVCVESLSLGRCVHFTGQIYTSGNIIFFFFSFFLRAYLIEKMCPVFQLSFEGASTFSPKPMDMSSIVLSWDQCVIHFPSCAQIRGRHYLVFYSLKE